MTPNLSEKQRQALGAQQRVLVSSDSRMDKYNQLGVCPQGCMKVRRGEIVLLAFPFTNGTGSKGGVRSARSFPVR